MIYEFKFPDVGEGLTEGTLVKWLVAIDDMVKTDQPVVEVETDKAVVSLPSPVSGKIVDLKFAPHDIIHVGDVIVCIEINGTNTNSTVPPQLQPDKKKPDSPSIARIDTNIQANKIIRPQNKSQQIQALPNVRKYAKEHRIDLTTITGSGKNGRILMSDIDGHVNANVQKMQDTVAPKKSAGQILATPAVRQLARKLGIDIESVSASGSGGKVTEDDVKKAAKQPAAKTPEPIQSQKIATPAPTQMTQTQSGAEERVPFSKIRQIIAKRLVESKNTTAQVTFADEADVTELADFVQRQKENLAKDGVKLTYLPFFIKALVATLRKFPDLNASLDLESNTLIRKKYYNIGIATDTPKGLLVPVVFDADKKNIRTIANDITALAQKSRDGTLALAEMRNATITISSVGNLGGQIYTPIINLPEVAILGIGKITEKPVVKNSAIVIRKMVYFSFSFDHRVVDGADAVRFMSTFIAYVQDPTLLLLENS